LFTLFQERDYTPHLFFLQQLAARPSSLQVVSSRAKAIEKLKQPPPNLKFPLHPVYDDRQAKRCREESRQRAFAFNTLSGIEVR
jgi:hypothetical protein